MPMTFNSPNFKGLFNEYIVQNFFKKIGLVASQTTELSYKVNEDNENFFYVMIAGFSMVIFLISIQISLLFNYNVNLNFLHF